VFSFVRHKSISFGRATPSSITAAGIVAFRLHSSYSDLNRSNAELAELNQSLEGRVAQRTEQLTSTVADLKESQVQLVQAEKMSSLGQLVAGISHEINTPLLYLANNAELIRERIALLERFVGAAVVLFEIRSDDYGDRAEYQQKFVAALKELKTMLRDDDLAAGIEEARDLVRDSIDGLADLTEIAQSLKDFSRLDRAPTARFDVNAGLDKTLLIARNVTKQKANVLRVFGEVPEIECSPSKINQVFLNLITNAAQAIETHGEIAVTTKLHDAEHVAVRIADTGCGIPPELMGKICDPFFTTKEVGAGTGLGLSIVDEIVRAHGGRLEIESQVGKGSAFTVILPIERRKEAPAEDFTDDDGTHSPADEHDELEPLAEAV
jgi:signal transduction histidine kinase